ncbi:putative DNA primase, small subunit [Rosa chinensis]|uniref:Putative DNA primase, small subunit n=1 Tax=Rosa chinensis TaxID=74649 RepID=A0A2P6QJT4_ROSCH|nr:putative DNA primase, small subunit [Rosa chinensis]
MPANDDMMIDEYEQKQVTAPAKRHSYAQNGCYPEERELIFDIDMSDYNDVRYCCSGADVCLECWPLMTIVIKVTDTALRDDLGFNHIPRFIVANVMFIVGLTNELRAAIANYFRVYKVGNENSHKRFSLMGSALHPFLVSVIIAAVTSELRGKWQDNRRTSNAKEDINIARWEQLKHLLQSGKQKMQGLPRCVEEIMFSYTYPRLDMEVSKHMNHLLKAPFCVYPKTGRVCVPIDITRCEEFDPTAVPTLSTVCDRPMVFFSPHTHFLSWWESMLSIVKHSAYSTV